MNGKRTISTALFCLLLAWPQGPFCLCCNQAFGSSEAVSTGAIESDGRRCCSPGYHDKTGIDPVQAGCPQCDCFDPAANRLYTAMGASQNLVTADRFSYRYDPAWSEGPGPARWESVPHVPGHQQRQAALAVWLK
ncbi:MAG: hypothetical protein MK108_10725 [Mariniblastus sp.]|nr:hypothetical protein [Mariniblastus sp.]